MANSAADLYEQLKAIHRQLEHLGIEGRIIRMDTNDQFDDAGAALMTALAAIETAINATCWMVTEPDSNGKFPDIDA